MTVCLDLKTTSSQTLLNKCLHSGSIVGICSSMVLLWCCSFKQCDINMPSILYLWITFCSMLVYLNRAGTYFLSFASNMFSYRLGFRVRVDSGSGCRSINYPLIIGLWTCQTHRWRKTKKTKGPKEHWSITESQNELTKQRKALQVLHTRILPPWSPFKNNYSVCCFAGLWQEGVAIQ